MPPIHLTQAELDALPLSGEAFERVAQAARNLNVSNARWDDQESVHDTSTLAAALLGAKGDEAMRTKALAALAAACAYSPPAATRTLAVARNVCSYVLAAALLDYRTQAFTSWVAAIRTRPFPSGARKGLVTLAQSAGGDPSNWGAHARASMAACSVFLDDGVDAVEADVRSFLAGDHDPRWKFGDDLTWHVASSRPVCVNPRGALIQGHPVGGVIPDDQRRAGGFSWPPPRTNYAWEGLQGSVTAVLILLHAGRDLTAVGDYALARAYEWLIDVADHPASGDDLWQPWAANYLHPGAAGLATSAATGPGKCMAWTDWTHAVRLAEPPPPPDPCEAILAERDAAREEATLARLALDQAVAERDRALALVERHRDHHRQGLQIT